MMMKRRKVVALLVCLLCSILANLSDARTIFVKADATGAHNGTSWADAYKELQSARFVAANGDQIWVAKGTYKPDYDVGTGTHTGNRTATFQLKNGVTVYGGLAGNEDPATFDLGSRDLVANETVLSGDLADNDGPSFANNDENSYHVVTGSGTSSTAVLDGFIVSGGNANGSSNTGGGMFNDGGSSPTLTRCTFAQNAATYGGGMYNYNSYPTLIDCVFSGNRASRGGGMYDLVTYSTLTNCTFSGNQASASDGGGIYNFSGNPTLTHCTFSGNAAYSRGGGLFNSGTATLTRCTFTANSAGNWNFSGQGGGMYDSNGNSTLAHCVFSGNSASKAGGGMYNTLSYARLINCTFSANTASSSQGGNGGGIYNKTDFAYPKLINCTLCGNSAFSSGGGMYTETGNPVLANCILWGNLAFQIVGSATATYTCIQGGWPGSGNIQADPLFENATDGDLRLQPGSPCIDAGTNAAVPAGILTDLDGHARFMNDPATPDCRWVPGTCGTAPIVDMGVYEYIAGDFDRDGDIDAGDLEVFEACASGPAVPYVGDCTKADFDGDDDVDQTDFAIFQRCYGGDNLQVDPSCAD